MEKLVNIFKRADSNDKLTYTMVGSIIVGAIILVAVGIANADELSNQTLERSIFAPASAPRLDR